MKKDGLHMHNIKSEQNNLVHHIRKFQNNDITKKGLTWPKSQTRLGKNPRLQIFYQFFLAHF